MPSRRRAWSSTESTRIRPGSLLMNLLCLPRPKPVSPTCAIGRCPVCNRAGNTQVYLRASSNPTPDVELRADLLGAFAHSRQTVMTSAAHIRDSRIDVSSIIANPQPEQRFAIRNLRFYPARLRMAERVSHRLPGNAVALVPENRMQVPGLAFHHHSKGHGILRSQFVAQGRHRLRQIAARSVEERKSCTASRPSAIA